MKFFDYRLRQFPRPAKTLALGYILTIGLAYVYGLLNIAMVVGFTPKQIAIHYYGSDKVIAAKAAGAEESLNLDAVEEAAEVKPQPSFKNLVSEGHFHLFGMASFFFALTLLGLFTDVPEKWKIALVGVPYISIILDNLSFLATRFVGPKLAYMTAISGGIMGICFTALWFAIFFELLRKPVAGKTFQGAAT
jgi:hypothetical protein